VEPEVIVQRAKRQDIPALVKLMTGAVGEEHAPHQAEVMEEFLSRGYMMARSGTRLLGAASWEAENLVATIASLYIVSPRVRQIVMPPLLRAIEEAANELLCEVALLAVPSDTASEVLEFYKSLGYEQQLPEELHKYWREAADSLLKEGDILLVKQLREKRIMHPI
jgi:hypothetical protein